jgi:hypothetical protein
MRLIEVTYGTTSRGDLIIQMIIDRSTNISQAIDVAKQYAATDISFPEMGNFIFPIPLPKHELARQIYAMQAADFISWECRKNMEEFREWFEAREQKEVSRIQWADENGELWPFPRRSMAYFMLNSATVLEGWTYDRLLLENDARKGVWSQSAYRRQLSASRRI